MSNKNNINISYKTNFIDAQEVSHLCHYLQTLQTTYKQSFVSELININTHQKSREVLKIKKYFQSKKAKPFEFIHCLN